MKLTFNMKFGENMKKITLKEMFNLRKEIIIERIYTILQRW